MRNSFGFMGYLAGLSILGYLATDMYLPAFSAMPQELQISAAALRSSLSVFLAGFAFAQLLWGALSDHLGRKPVLLLVLVLFALCCLGMLWVQNAVQLWSLRFIQEIGACSTAVTWQALVVDRYREGKARRIFATIMPLVALSPTLAPLMGALLLNQTSWRMIFAVLLGFSVLLLIRERSRSNPQQCQLLAVVQIASIQRQRCDVRRRIGWVLAWLTGSPFILSDMGYSPNDIGLSYMPQTLAFLFGVMATVPR